MLADHIVGDRGQHRLEGNDGGGRLTDEMAATGDDVLLGLAADDLLTAAADNDLLDGGCGLDSMAGGVGDDVFLSWTATSTASAR